MGCRVLARQPPACLGQRRHRQSRDDPDLGPEERAKASWLVCRSRDDGRTRVFARWPYIGVRPSRNAGQCPAVGRRDRQATGDALRTHQPCPHGGFPAQWRAASVGRIGPHHPPVECEHQASVALLTGHGDTIQQVVFSPDGAHLVSASSDHTVRSWVVGEDRPRWIFPGPEKFAAIEYSADGLTLAAADEDGSITLIDPESGTQRGLIRDEERVLRTFAFSPDGGILAAAGETGRVRFWVSHDRPRITGARRQCQHCPHDYVRARWIGDGLRQPQRDCHNLASRTRQCRYSATGSKITAATIAAFTPGRVWSGGFAQGIIHRHERRCSFF